MGIVSEALSSDGTILKFQAGSLTLLVMCVRSPPTRVANHGLNDSTFGLQVGEKKKKTLLGSSLMVKANFKWFILSKKQQLHATSKDQITVFQRKDTKFQKPRLEQEPGEVSQ